MQIIHMDQHQSYVPIWEKMKQFTQQRQPNTEDQLWLLEHLPVYTLGQAGKREHIINPQEIPVIHSDRGGQVTYHGPGQLIAYVLMDLQRRSLSIRNLVQQLEQVIIQLLQDLNIEAQRQCKAPGVYVDDKKIASIGLRVKANRTYHGIALNVDMDLKPFAGINPCGYERLKMTQIREYDSRISMPQVAEQLIHHYCAMFYANEQSRLVHVNSV